MGSRRSSAVSSRPPRSGGRGGASSPRRRAMLVGVRATARRRHADAFTPVRVTVRVRATVACCRGTPLAALAASAQGRRRFRLQATTVAARAARRTRAGCSSPRSARDRNNGQRRLGLQGRRRARHRGRGRSDRPVRPRAAASRRARDVVLLPLSRAASCQRTLAFTSRAQRRAGRVTVRVRALRRPRPSGAGGRRDRPPGRGHRDDRRRRQRARSHPARARSALRRPAGQDPHRSPPGWWCASEARRLRRALASVLLLAGCGLGAGETRAGGAQLHVTRDFGQVGAATSHARSRRCARATPSCASCSRTRR